MIDFPRLDARLHNVHCSLLCLLHRLVNCASLRRGATHIYGAGHIGTITREYNTEVADHEPLGWEGSARSPSVGQGRARSRSNNSLKGHGFGPGLASGILHFRSHIGFTDARTDGFKRAVEQTRAQIDRGPKAGNLFLVLYRSSLLN